MELEKESRLPKMLSNYLLIENPLSNAEEMEAELDLLPDDQRKEFASNYLINAFSNMEVVAVGPEVTGIKVGDKIISAPQILANAPVILGKYLIVKESSILAVWERE